MPEKLPEVFWDLHSGIPREGPGDNESTRRAFLMLKDLQENPRILDIGCGPGMQTIELAKLSNGQIDALDNHQPFLDELNRRAKEEGVSGRINAVNGNMCSLNYGNNSFDLIWCEGAIFIIGFEKGLREWRRLLTDNGYLVVSELSWLKPNPPEQVRRWLEEEYPAIKTIKENLEIARKCWYHVIRYFILPEKSWWTNYYMPLETKIATLKSKYTDDDEAVNVLASHELEIDMYRKYSEYYGYVFYIMQIE
jgi:ubiquinone/menaquinone biosynthesis C-methylase UbiE